MYAVTGASSGLGLEVVRQLAEDYPDEMIVGMSRGPLPGDLRAEHIALDLSDYGSVESAADQLTGLLAERDDRLHGLIHAAGRFAVNKVSDFDPEEAERTMRINVTGPALFNSRLYPTIVNHDTDIVGVTSTAAVRPNPAHIDYGASKAAQEAYLRGLRSDLQSEDTQARVMMFRSGAFQSGMVERATGAPHPRYGAAPTARTVAKLLLDTSVRLPKGVNTDLEFFV